MTAQEFFWNHSNYADERGHDMVIGEYDFLSFNKIMEEILTKKLVEYKDDTILLLEHLIQHEWNISSGGLTRIKEYVSQLKASK